MNVNVTARHFELSDQVREHAIHRVSRIERFGHALHDAHVVLEVEKYRNIAEVSIHGKMSSFTGKAESNDMIGAIDSACEKVGTQIRKHHDKVKKHNHKSEPEIAE
jgi:putative sigma-54 modulation protein